MRDAISLILNGEKRDIRGVPPTTTLLQWLRGHERLTGTKEGCAEGDCGACTVVVGERDADGVTYRAINACIALLPMLEGTSITTVEGVEGPGGELHPCQRAMVDEHGSQCGFCTPGFVMSLYAMQLTPPPRLSPAVIDDVLAGNLCRCTGYGPIVAAAKAMQAMPRPAWDQERREADAAMLEAIAHDETVRIDAGGETMLLPADEEALATLAARHPDAVIVSGATDVGLWVTKQGRDMPLVISTVRVRGGPFGRVEIGADGTVWIGAGVRHSEAASHLAPHVPELAELWRRFAGVQVRNAGTVGGNIANGSPIGDLAPAMIALGARLHLRHGATQRSLPIEDFFIAYGRQDRAPGEIVTGVSFALPAPDAMRCYKVSKRFDDDISAVCGCFVIVREAGRIVHARLAYGGMAATPKRARRAEAALIDAPWSEATIQAAMGALEHDFAPISDLRASADYRMMVARNLLRRSFIEMSDAAPATRLVGAAAGE
ncbi:MAG: xanthine dehydrogenase small subunit [Hyphomicrobiales bacterium]|nr:xanthine dehydrogenase small subunit [Hyphomicrobiales bacterium]